MEDKDAPRVTSLAPGDVVRARHDNHKQRYGAGEWVVTRADGEVATAETGIGKRGWSYANLILVRRAGPVENEWGEVCP